MHAAKSDIPVTLQTGDVVNREIEWGGINLAVENGPPGIDSASLFKWPPDDCCQCPHWGTVVKGSFEVRYKDREEVISAGEVYYLSPGHITITEEPTELIEFSPKGEYQKTLEVAAKNLAAMQTGS